ncbi:hypothetical protein, partial [Parageobacillus toebii]|uniref:hypothetical protein n=1 Tax=Parageobacillus toebii TaxID=153151 RepID=UPI002E1CD716|nr:hypothetical protein [Parageobacillus toebii]
ALTDKIQKNGSPIYDLHLFSANQKSSHKILTDSRLRSKLQPCAKIRYNDESSYSDLVVKLKQKGVVANEGNVI